MDMVTGVIVENKRIVGMFTLSDGMVTFRIHNAVCVNWTYEAFSTMANACEYSLIV